jgi:hypothetical protein
MSYLRSRNLSQQFIATDMRSKVLQETNDSMCLSGVCFCCSSRNGRLKRDVAHASGGLYAT